MQSWTYLAGFGLLVISLFLWIFSVLRYRQYDTTQATVTSIEIDYDSDGNKQFYAVYTFKDKTGTEYQGRSTSRSSYSPYKDGQSISVVYNPERPEKSTISSFREKYAWALTMTVMGLFFVVIGYLSR